MNSKAFHTVAAYLIRPAAAILELISAKIDIQAIDVPAGSAAAGHYPPSTNTPEARPGFTQQIPRQ